MRLLYLFYPIRSSAIESCVFSPSDFSKALRISSHDQDTSFILLKDNLSLLQYLANFFP